MKKEWNIDEIKKYLKNENCNTRILSKEYKNFESPLEFSCGECGEIFIRNLDCLINQKYKLCKKCSLRHRGITKRKYNGNINKIKDIYLQYGLILLDNEYKNNNTRMLCKDFYGYKGYVALNHLKRTEKNKNKDKTCFDYFSLKSNKENFIYNINNFCYLNGIKTKAIRILENKKFSRASILFLCECGNNFETTVNSFRYGKQKCDICSKKISRYEFFVKNFLDLYNIKYITQKRFSNCKNVLPLPFDFYIKEKNILIEIDGEGHYFPCSFNNCSFEAGEKSFNLTKKNDEIKTKYCENNNIKLIRIPYWYFNDKEEYKNELLNNVINV